MRVQSWLRLTCAASSLEEGLQLIIDENISETTVLPESPSDKEMLSYIDTRRPFIVGFGMLSCIPLCVGLWLFTVAADPFFTPIAMLVTAYLGISYFVVGIWGRDINWEEHKRFVDKSEYSPNVDVYLPCCGEPIEVLHNTFEHVSKLKWYRNKLNVYVLDDGPRPNSVRALADEFEFTYLRRKNVGEMKKAGNLKHAFYITEGDVIVIFDADFCPRSDFLYHTIPYFDKYPDVCIVQTPQFFRWRPHQTWVERGAGQIQELFYRSVQMARERHHAAICVGSCAVYRRIALDDIGGPVQAMQSEDVNCGMALTDKGWRVKYLPLCLSMGTSPDHLRAFFFQNMRWCGGSVELTTSKRFWKSNLNWKQKMCYVSGLCYYVTTGMSIITNALPAIYLVFMRPELVMYYNILFAVPSVLFPLVGMKLWSRQHYGLECMRIRWIQFTAHLFAIRDRVRGTAPEWVATGAIMKTKDRRFNDALRFLLYTVVTQMILLYSGCAFRIAQGYMWYNFVPSLCLETLNAIICFQVFYK